MSDSTDRDFYDRQRRVLGKEAMERLQKSKVMIVGLGGVGVETAKNVILTGVHTCYLYDEKNVTWEDLSANFYFSEHDLGSNRVDSCIGQLKELNTYVNVSRMRGEITEEVLEKIDVVVFTDELIHSLGPMNSLARDTNTKFIACEIRGLFGSLFNDMGDKFEVYDNNGEDPVENTVVEITNDNPSMVTILDDKTNHGLGIGDKVVFSHIEGMESLNSLGPIDIDVGEGTGKYTFRIKVDGTQLPKYKKGTGYCKQVKSTQVHEFLPLDKAIEAPNVINYDFGKWDFGKLHIHPLFRSLNEFVQKEKRFPRPYNEEDAKYLAEIVKKYDEAPIEDFTKLFSYGCRGKLNPMAALMGGFCAQEVQKALSGKYTPLNQWFYFDALECLDKNNLPKEQECQPLKCRYDGQIQVFGKSFQAKLENQKIFVVGAGALGCEYLKNFALMGIGDQTRTPSHGEIIVTDMDNIEMSNLNRQFLFRNRHIGKMKSKCAAETITTMNPKVKIDAMQDKVAPETEEVFNDNFWDGLDCIVNALDNVIARLYVDQKCVYFGRPLIEAGTLGPKANTQVVIPHMTESYGAQRDPPEKTFPACTIKNFPYKIDHCISWARELFEGYFHNEPKNVNAYLQNENFLIDLKENGGNSNQQLTTLEKIYENLVVTRPVTFEDCVEWARMKFQKHFHDDISQLMYNFPLDHKTKSGLKFWSGSKRPPTALNFDVNHEWEFECVVAMANIRAKIYGLTGCGIEGNYNWSAVLDKIKIAKFVPKKVKIKVTDDEEEEEEEEEESNDMMGMIDEEKLIEELLKKLPKPNSFAGVELDVTNFEKDDDTNFHVDFIAAASNCRGKNYNIPQVSKYKAKGIAGKIIPALVTSTALITGFGCLEFYKVVQGKTDIESYRNVYMNLALPSCTQSEPFPPKKMKYYDVEFTEWDKFNVSMGRDVKLKELIEYFKKRHRLTIGSLTFGKAMLYASFMPNEEALEKTMLQLAMDVTGKEPAKGKKYLDFCILAEDEEEEDVEVPDIKYQFRDF